MSQRVSSSSIVGRSAELAVGQARLQDVLDGGSDPSAAVLLISGEAGIGKTRLLDELLNRAGDAGAVVTCGRCLEHGGEVRPLSAVTEILADLGPAVNQPYPGSPPGAETAIDTVAPTARPPDALARLFDRVRSVLRTLSTRGPLVVAVEDLHWSDATTRELLSELVRTRGLERVLIIGTYRSDELHRRHPLVPLLADLEQAVRPERIELKPLGETAVVELAVSILGRPIGEQEARTLSKRSGGNPFYAEELLAVDGAERLPAGIRHVILAQAQDLEPDADVCLQAASTLALPIDQAVLQATARLEPDQYRLAVDSLCRNRFLIEVEEGFRFRHDLVREVFLDELLPGERSELFSRAARALENHRPERTGEIARLYANASELPEALRASVHAAEAAGSIGASAEASRHYGRALDLWDRVENPAARAGVTRIRLLRRAAEVADLAREFDVAVELARRAAAEAEEAGDPVEAGASLFDLSGYLWNAGAPGMDETIERALVVLPREPPTVDRARLEIRSAMNRTFAGETTEADLALEAAADMAAELGERGVEVTARAHVGLRRAGLGDERALQNLTDGFTMATAIDDGPAGTVIAINLTNTLVLLGRFQEAAELHDRGFSMAERHGYAATRGIILEGNVMLALEVLGRWDDAETIMGDIERRLSPDSMHRWASAFLGWTQIEINRGNHAGVVASYHRGLEMWETGYYGGDQLPVGTGLIQLAAAGEVEPINVKIVEAWLADVRPEYSPLAARLVATAARHLVPPRSLPDHGPMIEIIDSWIQRLQQVKTEYVGVPPVLDAWLDQARAELVEAAGDPAPDRWADLATSWDRLGCSYFAAEARYRQADALLRAGGGRSAADRAEATRLLGEAGRTANELAAQPLQDNIEDLARRARLRIGDDTPTSAPAPSEPTPFGLTGRERQVLHLVNEGRSNGEIGAALFISTKTASVHVSNILRKLGAANRIEAAAIARRHRLFDG